MSQPIVTPYRKFGETPSASDDSYFRLRNVETSKTHWLAAEELSKLNLNIQASMIYSESDQYVAGKIVQVDGLDVAGKMCPSHIRVHVVVLPDKKYAKKTKWVKVDDESKVHIGEYFKYIFPLFSLSDATVRIRVYGRILRLGSIGRSFCMGECYVSLVEVCNSRAGLTINRKLIAGIKES